MKKLKSYHLKDRLKIFQKNNTINERVLYSSLKKFLNINDREITELFTGTTYNSIEKIQLDVAQILLYTLEYFEGDEHKLSVFFTTANPTLDYQKPRDVILNKNIQKLKYSIRKSLVIKLEREEKERATQYPHTIKDLFCKWLRISS